MNAAAWELEIQEGSARRCPDAGAAGSWSSGSLMPRCSRLEAISYTVVRGRLAALLSSRIAGDLARLGRALSLSSRHVRMSLDFDREGSSPPTTRVPATLLRAQQLIRHSRPVR